MTTSYEILTKNAEEKMETLRVVKDSHHKHQEESYELGYDQHNELRDLTRVLGNEADEIRRLKAYLANMIEISELILTPPEHLALRSFVYLHS